MRRSFCLLSKDPFTVLGLTRSATKSDVKTRYRELARRHHPDAEAGDSSMMEQINRAYNFLLKEGGYERLRARPAVMPRGQPDVVKPHPFSRNEGPSDDDDDGSAAADLSDEAAAKLGALDPATERVTPEGRYMYQSRDDGSWVELRRPLVRAHQPRYASFAAHAEMSDELRRRAIEKEKEQNAKSSFQRVVDRMSDSSDLPTRNPILLRLYFLLVIIVGCVMYRRAFAWHRHHRGRNSFYESLGEEREELLRSYESHREILEASAAAAAIVFLAASEHKRLEDPVVPPTMSTHFQGVRPPREHFHVISGG